MRRTLCGHRFPSQSPEKLDPAGNLVYYNLINRCVVEAVFVPNHHGSAAHSSFGNEYVVIIASPT